MEDSGLTPSLSLNCTLRDSRYSGRTRLLRRLFGSCVFPGGLLGAGRLRLCSSGPLLCPPTPYSILNSAGSASPTVGSMVGTVGNGTALATAGSPPADRAARRRRHR